LERRLEAAERLNRELSDVLSGMGIKYQQIVVEKEPIG
jgi:hypothetical protein